VGVVDDRSVLTFDLTASILAAAGCSLPQDRPLDGIDVLGQIARGEPAEPRALFWRARRANRTWKAVRRDNLKYVSRQDDDGLAEFLFDLSADPGESKNLLEDRREEVAALKQQLAAWEADVK
jgi:N-acetylgalactosamine-6-sulfatase